MKKEIDIVAKKYANIPINRDMEDKEERYYNPNVNRYDSFIAGVNSDIAKKIKFEFAINLLKSTFDPEKTKSPKVLIRELKEEIKKLKL